MDKQTENITNEEKLSPLLESLRNKNSFRVPEDYFANAEQKIMSNIKEEYKGRTVSLTPWIKISMGMVAGIILVLGIYFLKLSQSLDTMSSTQLQSALKTLPEEELNTYLMNHTEGLNNELLAQTLDINNNIYNIKIDSSIIDSYINEADMDFITEQN